MKIKTLLTAAILACSAFYANALTITSPSPLLPSGTGGVWYGYENNGIDEAQISALVGSTVTLQYKQNVGGSEEGGLGGSYETSFQDDPTTTGTDYSGATITYVGGPFIDATKIYAYVKDGNAEPNWFLFDISTWNGTEQLVFENFFLGGGNSVPKQGAISHVSIFSTGGTNVPDGGATALMLGFGILGIGFVSRRLHALKA